MRLTTTGGATLENALTVSLSAAAAAGTEAGDATFGALGSFIFAAGSGNNTTNASLTFSPNSDTLVEGNELATLTPSGETLNGRVTYTANDVTIADADSATVAFQSATTTVGEDAAATNVTLVLSTAAGNTLENNATIQVSASNGTAENTDYDSGSFPKTVTFTAGQGNNGTQTVSLDPASDTLVEGNETVTLAIVDGTLLTGSGQTTNTVTITDADSATVAFQSATTTVGEDAAATNLTLVLSTAAGNTLENDATIQISATNGTAEDLDYDSGSYPRTVTFTAGQGNNGTQTVSFAPASDTLVEGNETVTLAIVDGVLLTGSGQTTNTVTITDADSATVIVDAGQTVLEDGGPQNVTVRLTTTGGATLENALTVSLSAAAAAGTEAGDATFGALGSFLFAAGSGNNTAATSLTFSPNSDTLVEGNELATLTPSGETLNGRVTYTANDVTIADADSATVAFQSATTTVGEDAAATNLTLVLSTAAGNTLENNATIQVSASNGTAENPDYDSGSFPGP